MVVSNKILVFSSLLLTLAIVPSDSLCSTNKQHWQIASSNKENDRKFIFMQNRLYLPTITKDTIAVNFKYFNSTGKPQLINKVLTRCGCTQVRYPKKPIRRGEQGVVEVTIDVGRNKGHFEKSIVVYFQGHKSVILRVSGYRI